MNLMIMFIIAVVLSVASTWVGWLALKSQLVVHDPEPERDPMSRWDKIHCAACVLALFVLWMFMSWGLMPL